jgi:phosphate:Na+ symporter
MDIFSVLTFIGGLALFLYGMHAMSGALEKASGSKLGVMLEKMTNSCFKGILLGVLVTGVIQSSSATTVMVVGFVMRHHVAYTVVGVIWAQYRHDVTSWIISLIGSKETLFFLQLLNDSFALVCGVGNIMIMSSTIKKERTSVRYSSALPFLCSACPL